MARRKSLLFFIVCAMASVLDGQTLGGEWKVFLLFNLKIARDLLAKLSVQNKYLLARKRKLHCLDATESQFSA